MVSMVLTALCKLKMAARTVFRSSVLFFVFCIIQALGQECISPLGMEDGRMKDSQITTSGVARGTTAGGWKARLNRNIAAYGAWCVNVSGGSRSERNYDQYIQIDLVNMATIAGIATQGREHAGGKEYVKDYKISYSKDSLNWISYKEKYLMSTNNGKIFQGNTDVSSVVRHVLDPAIIARYIRVHPGYDKGKQTCMRLELYGCLFGEVILSYSMPVGQKTKNGEVEYKDTTYTGVIINDFYKNGTGILTDGRFGPVDAKSLKGKGWVGWNNTKREYIDTIFEFSDVRKFKDVTLTVNVDKNRSHAVFNKSQIFFASTQADLSGSSFLEYCSRGYKPQDNQYNANVTLSLCENTARFIKLRLYFGGIWLLITEISFNSDPAIGNAENSLRSCSEHGCIVTQSPTSSSLLPVGTSITTLADTKSTVKPNGRNEKSTNLTGTFVAVAVIVVILTIVLVVGFLLYRRRQALKLSTDVLAVEMQSQSPMEPPTESSQNIQHDYEVPTTNDEAAPVPYEEVQFSPPTYIDLDITKRNKQKITDNNTYQKLLKPDIEYAYPTVPETAPYEYVQNPPATAYTELDTNQRHPTANNHAYQKLLEYDPDYVIPADGHDETELYEEVGKEKTPPGHTELDANQRHQTTNNDAYQKLLKCDSDYVIPADGHDET